MRQEVRARISLTALLGGVMLAVSGCQKPVQIKPDYNRPLPPGSSALRLLLNENDWPAVAAAWDVKDDDLLTSLERSLKYYDAPSSKKFFPVGDVTHLRARTSAYAMRRLISEAQSASDFERLLKAEFNCYTSVGYDDKGSVLFTGYFTPIFTASRTRTQQFKYPLYKKPADLEIQPITGKVLGRKAGSGYTPYPTRGEIERTNLLDGKQLELAWVADRLDQYIIHVNGSARLDLTDGGVMYIGYAGNNGHEYTGLGKTLLDEGVIEPERLGLPAIREHFRANPGDLDRYINMNDRYVFFTEYEGGDWPAGSLGVKATPMRTLATDKDIFPRGAAVMVTTKIPDAGGAQRPFAQLMVDQDTGGAIRAAGRGDLYMGIGPQAERLAGRQFAEGRLYYFFLKNERVLEWYKRMSQDESLRVKPKGHLAKVN